MFSETHFIFMLFETNLVFMLFAFMLFGNSQSKITPTVIYMTSNHDVLDERKRKRKKRERKKDQSRICGKGVGLSLFPSDSRSFESYEQFVRKSKKSKDDCFFWPFLG